MKCFWSIKYYEPIFDMRYISVTVILSLFEWLLAISPEFNDQLLHEINWHDSSASFRKGHELKEKIYLTTNDNERYQCILPKVDHDGKNFDSERSEGASPETLLSEVLNGETKKCSYRLEPFWTYELCHGEKVSQYHEEKDAEDGVKRTEYLLGKLSKKEVKDLLDKPQTSKDGKSSVPFRKIDNKATPYYSVVMDNGSLCELNNKPRKTTVLYICHPTSSNEIMSIKEVTTCEYEVIVLTPTLCSNPAYLIKATPTHNIDCHALSGSPRYPVSLERHEKDEITRKFVINIPKTPDKPNPTPKPDSTVIKPSNDITINNKFLRGEYCLIGGSGWWQYEFCHGRHVLQFHEEYGRPKTIIKLGFWDEEKHLEYMKSNKLKPKGKKYVLHFYSGGEKCDVTGLPREARVKLICKEGSGQQLSIYMTEDELCKYTVGVESPILCPLIANADENGLFDKA